MSESSVPPYAAATAPYGTGSASPAMGATVVSVRDESPAWEAGIEPGMVVTEVNGRPLTDMIVWLWEADSDSVELTVLDPADGASESCVLSRGIGEDWGLDFDGAVFDGMRTCVNACAFCFMTMLPAHMRSSLYIRDDDYRLSFLQGNFVTLTNMDDADVADVISRRLSPMNVSLHAVSPEVRRRLMGRNAARGMEVLGRLMKAGIEIHAQIVLCPGINDGPELERTLGFCERHPEITSLGIVPLGYTRHQSRFASSYSDDAGAARAVIESVAPYQARARERVGRTVFQLSDEFYLDAGIEVPPAELYDGYPQYYDGIGMIRSYIDEARELACESERLERISRSLADRGLALAVVSGEGAAETVSGFVSAGPLSGRVVSIRNDYFGGNVDVTGLICACDLLSQVGERLDGLMLFLPEVMFNADGLTLDGYHQEELCSVLASRGAVPKVSSTLPRDLVESLERALGLVHGR